MKIPSTAVILAAAGAGRRLGGRTPKAMVKIAGKPLFFHSLDAFAALPFVREIVIVLPERWIEPVHRAWGPALMRLRVSKLVPGGARRQDSVLAGLRVLTQTLVLVHDAARPLISRHDIQAVARAAARHGAAVLASPAVDTIKVADARGRVRTTPERSLVWHAQTPQGFRRTVLLEAYRKCGLTDATDDAQIVERAGRTVMIVPGLADNFKVTSRQDLLRAAKLLDLSRRKK